MNKSVTNSRWSSRRRCCSTPTSFRCRSAEASLHGLPDISTRYLKHRLTSSMRMERRLFRSLLLLSLVSLGTSCPALARTLYVIAGSDADARMGDGSADRPFTSLHEAVRQLEPGDELLLRAGTYALTEPVRLGPGGREDAWVTIKAAGDGRVVLDGSGLHRTRQINARLGSTGLLHIEGP